MYINFGNNYRWFQAIIQEISLEPHTQKYPSLESLKWWSACLASMRPPIQIPVPPKKEKKYPSLISIYILNKIEYSTN
jgi:hypothetical protein